MIGTVMSVVSRCNGRAESRRGAPDFKHILEGEISPAVVPQIDHCIGKGFECVVQLTETFKAQEQAPELVFPGEQPLDGTEPLWLCRSKRWTVEFRRYKVADERIDEDAEPGVGQGTETLALSAGGDFDVRALVRRVSAESAPS